MDEKQCTRCGETKPHGNFYANRRYADGYMSWCKACSKAYCAEYRSKNPDKLREQNKEYRAKRRDQISAAKRDWRLKNAEAEADRDRRRRRQNPEKHRQRVREWAARNPEAVATRTVRRRARSSLAQPAWLDDAQLASIALKYKEARLMSQMTGVRHEVDHIVPLKGDTVSGLHVPWNLRVITLSHNRKKYSKACT